jgi:DMSO reductase anchor subunit
MSSIELWRFLPLGYILTILIETPILVLGLSQRHSQARKLLAGVWLTACTYPIVTLVLPLLFNDSSRTVYLMVAETFAPVAECMLFWLAFWSRSELGKDSMWRDFVTIVSANLASFLAGEVFTAYRWFGLLE